MKKVIFYILALMLMPICLSAQQTYSFQSGNDGNWSNGAQWTPTGVPGPADTAIVIDGEVFIDSAFTVARLVLQGTADLSGSDTLTITSSFDWERAILDGSAAIVVEEGAALTIDSPDFKQLKGDFTLINKGVGLWKNGRLSNSGSSCAFINKGTLTLSNFSNSRVFNNGHFLNEGTFIYDVDKEGTFFGDIQNNGEITVKRGLLEVGQASGSVVDDGDYTVESGARLAFGFGSGERILSGLSNVDATNGSLEFNRGTISINGAFSADSVFMTGTGANVDFDNDIDVNYMELSSGSIRGSGTVTVTGQMDWSAGTMREAGTTHIAQGAVMNFVNNGLINMAEERILMLEGETNWNGGGSLSGVGNIYNYGAFSFNSGADFEPTTFINHGHVKVTSDGIEAFTRAVNHGLVEVQSGYLNWHNKSQTSVVDSGEFNVHAGAQLHFADGSRVLARSSILSGNGVTGKTGTGEFAFHGSVRPDSALVAASSGELTFAGDLALDDSSVTLIEIGGYTPAGEYDVFRTNGLLNIAGTLELSFIANFIPALNDTFSVLRADSLAGIFAEIRTPPGYEAEAEYLNDRVRVSITQIATDMESPTVIVPQKPALLPAYPNPFNPRTTIALQVAQTADVTVQVVDQLGRRVAVLYNGRMEAGQHNLYFDGTRLASGVYFVQMKAGPFLQTRKIVLLK